MFIKQIQPAKLRKKIQSHKQKKQKMMISRLKTARKILVVLLTILGEKSSPRFLQRLLGVYYLVIGLAKQVFMSVLDDDTAVASINLATKDIVHRSVDIQSRAYGVFNVSRCTH